MNKLQTGLKAVGKVLDKNSPSILTGLAVGGLIGTVILAIKETPKAVELLENKMEECLEKGEEFDILKKAKVVIPVYAPSILTGVGTIACIIGANTINEKRRAALAIAYSLSEKAAEEYKDAFKKLNGEKKESKIYETIAEKELADNPIDGKTVTNTGNGNVLMYDSLSGRYFLSEMEAIKRSENEFNHDALNERYCSLNDWYYLIGLEPIKMGRAIGWSCEAMLDLIFTSKITHDGRPCIVIDYRKDPRAL